MKSTYLNDVRVDTSKGKAWHKLSGTASTSAETGFRPIVEGRHMILDNGQDTPEVPAIPADGIALSPNGATLYSAALSGRTLYSVLIAGLRDREISDEALEKQVSTIGEKDASNGLLMDAAGRLYATDYEHNAIHVLDLTANGHGWSTLARDPRPLWPDTLLIGPNGDIHITANQLHRQPQYRAGQDARDKPYVPYRISADGKPIPADHGAKPSDDAQG